MPKSLQVAELEFEHKQSGSEINLIFNVKDSIQGKESGCRNNHLEVTVKILIQMMRAR